MKRKTIWTLLLLIGAASSNSCRMHSDPGDEYVLIYLFRNATIHSVEMTGYTHGYNPNFSDEPFINKEYWQIEPNSSVEFSFSSAGAGTLPLHFCDSVQIVFDAKKMLTYRNAFVEGGGVSAEEVGTIYDPDRYVRTEIDKWRTHFLYEITEADYEQAVEIWNAPASGIPARPMQ